MKLLIVPLLFCSATFVAVAQDNGYTKWAAEQVREALRQKKPITWKKDASVVPTAEVATALHAVVAGAIYGKSKIEKQRPFQTIRSGDFWVVFGSLPKGCMGGTAVTVIRASNGEVMRIIHEQ